MTDDMDDAAAIEEIVQRLVIRFPLISQDTIRETVTDAYEELRDAHVRDFVGVLVEKESKKRLKRLAS